MFKPFKIRSYSGGLPDGRKGLRVGKVESGPLYRAKDIQQKLGSVIEAASPEHAIEELTQISWWAYKQDRENGCLQEQSDFI
jgi:hypothetical protein